MTETLKIKDREYMVTAILRKIGIPANLRGFYYLREAIMMLIEGQEILGAVTKLIYPAIAKKYGTSAASVERAIRHAITVAWGRSQGKVFGDRYDYNIDTKPSNSEFIACIADELYLNLKYEEKDLYTRYAR